MSEELGWQTDSFARKSKGSGLELIICVIVLDDHDSVDIHVSSVLLVAEDLSSTESFHAVDHAIQRMEVLC